MHESTQKRLLAETDLTLKRAMEMAQGHKAAERNSKALKSMDVIVQNLATAKQPSTKCYRCGNPRHDAKDCRFRNVTRYNCGKVGHITSVCQSTRMPRKSRTTSSKCQQDRNSTWSRTKWLVVEDSPSDSEEEFQLLTIGTRSSHPISVDLVVNGKPLTMEVDTGAADSVLSEQTFKSLFPDTSLEPTNVVLKTYTGERMQVHGELTVEVQYLQQPKKSLTLLVVAGDGPSLFGHNWLSHIRLDWKSIGAIGAITASPKVPTPSLEALLKKHEGIFFEELGTIRPLQAELQVCSDARPKYCKARPVPFAIREAIENELQRLEAAGIIKPVKHSDWAAPVMVVPKKDVKLRLCGDYKISINQALEVEQYPLPKPDE